MTNIFINKFTFWSFSTRR